MNNLINLKNLKNDEIGIYVIMVVIILVICFLPTNNFITDITKNTGSLITAFVCVCLFMLLDNRLAVLFLVLLVVSYYKNMKNNLAEKFNDSLEDFSDSEDSDELIKALTEQVSNLEDNAKAAAEEKEKAKATIEAATTAAAEAKAAEAKAAKAAEEEAAAEAEKILSLGMSQPGLSILEQRKTQQENNINLMVKTTENKLQSALSNVNDKLNKTINDSQALCATITDIDENKSIIQENFLKGRIPEIMRENFVKGGVPFNNQERARNFKDSTLVKNLNGLATQNDRSGYDITGCRIVTSNEESITKTYDTLNGPPLATTDYNTLQKEFVGTPFYPLNN